jgi:lysophospholipase
MDLFALAKNPIPSGGIAGVFDSHDGFPLRYARWEATRSPRRGTVVLFEGRGEFIEKYFEVIADLRRRGFAVAIHDWRGQGGSHRPLANRNKGHVLNFAEYDRDVARFMRDIVLPDCPPPYIAVAHSMGGNILLRNATASGSWFDRMVLSAPMIALADAKVRVPQWLARGFAEVMCACGAQSLFVPGGYELPAEAGPFEGNALTSDPDRFARNRQIVETYPALGLGSPTIGWLRAAFRSSGMLIDPQYASRIETPILLLGAGRDRIVSTAAIEAFANRLKLGTHVLINASRHEILQERDEIRAQFWAAFDAYLGVNAAVA